MTLAGQTQNRRLLAADTSYTDLTRPATTNLDLALARDYALRASQLLGDEDRDHLYRELVHLTSRILRSTTAEESVRAWCMGDLGGKYFQEIQERFAEVVIPRVWNRLDRKVCASQKN